MAIDLPDINLSSGSSDNKGVVIFIAALAVASAIIITAVANKSEDETETGK